MKIPILFAFLTGCGGVLGNPDYPMPETLDVTSGKPAENVCIDYQCGPGEECLPHNGQYPTMCCFPVLSIHCPNGQYHILYDCKDHGYVVAEC